MKKYKQSVEFKIPVEQSFYNYIRNKIDVEGLPSIGFFITDLPTTKKYLPLTGAPVSMFNNAVYYRTIPASEGRTHIPLWRSKGYFKISNNTAISKITSFNDPIVKELTPSCTILERNGESVHVQTDYLIME